MTLSLLLFKLLSVLGLSFVLATPQATCVTPEETAKHAFAPPPSCAVAEPVEDKREGVSPPDGSSRSAAPSGGDASADDSDDGISNGI
ncbi:MAG: hypothetical protein IPN01_29100 [Deltaproteobacteria bacterium]|nr:hypothetical protein [Deltaproteobacteria bacterium]MBK9370303.1 hypothetical protein [Deltaproteobacteria bacterium]